MDEVANPGETGKDTSQTQKKNWVTAPTPPHHEGDRNKYQRSSHICKGWVYKVSEQLHD
tara:strand:+ start:554 stop:730 length:177 start_codon:yes stop_codon:yes gene_type:complete